MGDKRGKKPLGVRKMAKKEAIHNVGRVKGSGRTRGVYRQTEQIGRKRASGERGVRGGGPKSEWVKKRVM